MDLRVITLTDDQQIVWDTSRLDEPISGLEAALQRLMVALYTTPGTMVDAPDFGGGVDQMVMEVVEEKNLEMKVSEKILAAKQSLLPNEPTGDPYAIEDISLKRVDTSPERGFDVHLNVFFSEALRESIKIRGNRYAN